MLVDVNAVYFYLIHSGPYVPHSQRTESGYFRVPQSAEAPTPAVGRVAIKSRTYPHSFAKVGYVWALAWTLHQALSWSGREKALEQLNKYAGIKGQTPIGALGSIKRCCNLVPESCALKRLLTAMRCFASEKDHRR